MIVEHWVTKRIEKGKRRVFFKKLPETEGRLIITFKGLLGIENFNLKANLVPNASWFYVDVPTRTWILTIKFFYVFLPECGLACKGNFRASGYFEDYL
jgi:hypothetical protein